MKLTLDILKTAFTQRGYSSYIQVKEKHFFRRVASLPEDVEKLDPKVLYITRHKERCKELASSHSLVICGDVGKETLEDYDCNYLHIPAVKDAFAMIELIFEIQGILGDFEEDLYNEVLKNSSLQKCIELISNRMGNPCYIIDSSFKCLAIENNANLGQLSHTFKRLLEYGYLPINTVLNVLTDPDWLADSKTTGASIMNIPTFYCPFISYKIREQNKLQGYLFVVGILQPLSQGDLDVIDQIGPIVEPLVYKSINQSTIQGNYYEHFLKDVLLGRLQDWQRIKEQLITLNWQMDDNYYLLYCPVQDSSKSAIRMLIDHIEEDIGGKSFFHEDALYCICCIDNAQDFQQDVKMFQSLLTNYKLQAGVSIPFTGFHKLNRYAKQPRIALEIGNRLNPGQSVYLYKDYSIKHMLILYAQNMNEKTLFPKEYVELKHYDKRYNTQYVETLFHYIRNDRSLIKTAEIMHIHRNTLLHRLDKIKELTSLSLEDPNIKQLYLLSYEMDDLIRKGIISSVVH